MYIYNPASDLVRGCLLNVLMHYQNFDVLSFQTKDYMVSGLQIGEHAVNVVHR